MAAARILRGTAGAVLIVFAACATQPEVPARAPLPPAEYRTQADQFAELQRAGLAADYAAFAGHLGGNEQSVVAQLREAFGGGPFDLYTADAVTEGAAHRRLVELRGQAARLYLYLALDRAPGGWNSAGYELGRDREAMARRLSSRL